jgi:hypothetical protein
MSDQSLLLLLDEVRGKTVRLLQGVSEKEARWSPPGLHNHVLWHAGQSYVLVESLAMEAHARFLLRAEIALRSQDPAASAPRPGSSGQGRRRG